MSNGNNISNISEDTGNGESVVLDKKEVLSRKYFLKRKRIGISISESDNLTELGYSVAHVKDAMIELARYIIASGGNLAYGGDMRQGGFTELLFDLLAYYKADKGLEPAERFTSYLAYPISTTLTAAKEAELKQQVTFKKVAPPVDIEIANPKEFLKPDSTENLYIWTRCLTKMRQEMESECSARVFIGGRAKGYKGKCPGILEELLIAIENKHPVYLVGAFGGITRDAIEALSGKLPDSLTDGYHLANTEYNGLFTLYNQKHTEHRIDYSKYYTTLQTLGIKGVAAVNGLTVEENLRLANTPHISEMVYLIIKGLTNCLAN